MGIKSGGQAKFYLNLADGLSIRHATKGLVLSILSAVAGVAHEAEHQQIFGENHIYRNTIVGEKIS